MTAALYFDGKTAAAHPVNLTLEAQTLLLRADGIELQWRLSDVQISERLGNTPRLLTFPDGSHCEVTDHAALDAMLPHRRDWLDRMQHSLPWALLSAVLIVAALLAAYRYLLPWGAEVLAQRAPASVLQQMGRSTLETLDRFMLQPSTLNAARQQTLTAKFAALRPLPGADMQYNILFRSAPGAGPNAFALPDGTIVLLDELVALTEDDNEILAVLAHERGHVEHRHGARMVLQSSAVGLVIGWYMGDVSSLLTTIPAAVLEAGYSRDMEREADEYAAHMLQHNTLSPCLLTDMLNKLETAHQPNETAASQPDAYKVMDYLASHPATGERATLLCPGSR
ncbi:MAG: M48 family metallopeptidase [Gallionella sp.]|jgi:Zn-dependent protease with chaperone function|nr:M48 family metallopeptidase [Gallionella sp.]MCK9354488.1 M48 family metallopeptidase [Gallionella sp.]